jgi:hypothetical protein
MTSPPVRPDAVINHGPPIDREKIALTGVLFLYAIVQIIDIGRGGHMGQDWVTHYNWIVQATTHPWDWFYGRVYQTNPPLYHLIMAPLFVFLRPRFAFEAMGLANVLVSLLELVVLWKTLQLLVESVWIRFAALISITFLPAFVIGSVVIATDAFSQLPVCILALVFARYATDRVRLHQVILVSTLAVAFAVSIKGTAIVLVPGVTLALFVISKTLKQWNFRFFCALGLFALLTGSLALYWNFARPASALVHYQWKASAGEKVPELMNVRSALFFRSGDRVLLNGSSAWDLYAPQSPSLGVSNSFSYPGLLAFGLYTDMLDVLQPHKRMFSWGLIGKRTDWSRKISRISLRIGLVTFCASVVGVAIAGFHASRLYLFRSERRSAAVLAILILGAGWTAVMTIVMLTVHVAYVYQYWHPRLMLPAVVLLAIPVAWLASEILRNRTRLQIALLAGCVCQALVHLGVILGR